jgi:hypothetical protein
MATTAGTILADVLDRVRDPNATMNSSLTPPTTAEGQAFVYAQMTSAQRFVNAAERSLLKATTFIPTANTALYSVSVNIPDCFTLIAFRVVGVGQIDGPVDFKAFGRHDRGWLATTFGTAFVGWAPIGKDMFVLVPVFAVPPTVTIQYVPITNTLTLSTDTLQVTDDVAIHVSRLTELICRIKTRQLEGFSDRLQWLTEDMGRSFTTGESTEDKGPAL